MPPGVLDSAVLHVAALGVSEVFVNGLKVGDALLEPGFSTNLTERLLYSTYDASHALANLSIPR